MFQNADLVEIDPSRPIFSFQFKNLSWPLYKYCFYEFAFKLLFLIKLKIEGKICFHNFSYLLYQ